MRDRGSPCTFDEQAGNVDQMPDDHPLIAAVRPVAKAVGGRVVKADRLRPGDVELIWEGEVVGGFRPPDLLGMLDRMIHAVERELGAPLKEVSREQRQEAVRLLEERGAFTLRKSVEIVADALGVSRFTVYNYINRNNEGDD
jgi:hypothetical protein